MLQLITATLYISLLCWTYGYITIRIFGSLALRHDETMPHASIVCMTGLASLAVVGGWLSLFMPLGAFGLQAALLLGALAYWVLSKTIRLDWLQTIRHSAGQFTLAPIMLLAASCLLVLIMGSWRITHPDTLGYHAQLIQWIEKYKVIPGLVHVHVRYGLQSYWYLLCALFSFPFLHSPAITFVNTTVLSWYLLFVCEKISISLMKKEKQNTGKLLTGMLFLLLLAINLWDFGQLRISAVSASPDFIAGLYCWLVLYLLAGSIKSGVTGMLTIFLSLVAVMIKLSCVPILLTAVYALYRLLATVNRRSIYGMAFITVLAVIPFAARNVITSGYLVFPSVYPDWVNTDWKLSRVRTIHVKEYIAAYARVEAKVNMGEQPPLFAQHFSGWLPVWWQNRSGAEKCMLGAMCISLVAGLLFAKELRQNTGTEERLLILVCAGAIIFWFLEAPDPRFAYGFIMPFTGMIMYRILAGRSWNNQLAASILRLGVVVLTAALAAYSIYRIQHFFFFKNIVTPEGIAPIASKQITIRGITYRVPFDGCECGNTAVPCIYDIEPFLMRGSTLNEGFRSKELTK